MMLYLRLFYEFFKISRSRIIFAAPISFKYRLEHVPAGSGRRLEHAPAGEERNAFDFRKFLDV